MAVKTFRQFFNTFKGVHERFTHLTRPLEYSVQCNNLILDSQNNLTDRYGRRQFAQTSVSPLTSSTIKLPTYGLHNYRYQALDGTGEIEEVIGISNHFFRLKKGTITFQYTGSGTGTVSHYMDSSGFLNFGAAVNGVNVYDIADVTWGPLSASVTLGALKDGIEANANWTVTISGYAKVNGTQSGRNFNNAITVDSGHTITVATDRATMLGYYSTNGTPDLGYDFATVVETGATTLRVKPKSSVAVIDLTDNAYLGTGLLDMTILPYFNNIDVKTSAKTYDFYYWERVPWGSDKDPTVDCLSTTTSWLMSPLLTSVSNSNNIRYFPGSPEFQNYKLVTYDNCVYTAAQGNAGQLKTYNVFTSTQTVGRKSGLLQYDGQSWHQAIMPVANFSLSDGGSGSLTEGVYKYIARLKFIDYQENEHYGEDTISAEGEPRSITLAASKLVSLDFSNLATITNSSPAPKTPLRTNVADGYQVFTANTPVNIAVLSGSDTDRQYGLYIGDTAAFVNADTNQIVRAKVTAINYVSATSYTITITPPENGSIANGALISNNYVYEVFRTEPNNNQFYYVAEIPIAPSLTQSYKDNNVSVSANALYDGPFTGAFRRDVPPQLSTLEEHQGLLIGAGDPDRPNSLYWCNADDPWNWSASTNELTVTPGGRGPISAIASSDDNTFGVFGNKGVSFIAGDFASGALSEVKRYEGDVGCPSRHGAVKIRDSLWWLSNSGLRSATGAILNPPADNFIATVSRQDYQLKFNEAIETENSTKKLVKKCVAVNNTDSQYAIWCIPSFNKNSTTPKIVFPGVYSKILYVDYQNNFFSTWTHSGGPLVPYGLLYPVGGACVFKGKLLTLGYVDVNVSGSGLIQGALFTELGDYGRWSTTGQFHLWNFYEFTGGITHALQTAFDHLGDPSVDKQFLRLKIYTEVPLEPESETELFHRWNTRLITYKNFFSSTYSSNYGTDTTITFTDSQDYEQVAKLLSEKARAMQFYFSGTTSQNSLAGGADGTISGVGPPVFTGIEYEVALDYKKEEVQKT